MLIAYMPDNPLTSFDQVREGADWRWERVDRTLANQAIYRGDLTSLFQGRTKTARNGLFLIESDKDYVVSNWFRLVTDFYIDAMLAEGLPILSETPARQAFIDNIAQDLLDKIEAAIRTLSHGGYFSVAATLTGRVRTIPAWALHPVVDPTDSDDVLGYVLAYSYFDAGDAARQSFVQQDNRIRIIKAPNEVQATAEIYSYSPGQIGTLLETGVADIAGLFVFGDGMDDYTQIKALCAEGMVLQTLIGYGLHRHMNPILSGPGAWAQTLQARGEEQRLQQTATGLLVPMDQDDPPPEFVSADVNVPDAMMHLEWIAGQVEEHSGLPDWVLRKSGAGESGEARDRLLFPAMSRIRVLRRHIENIIPPLLDALGAPPGDTTVQWVDNPFSSLGEREAQILGRFTAGVIDENEARLALGYPEREEENAEANEEGPFLEEAGDGEEEVGGANPFFQARGRFGQQAGA